MWPDQVSNPGPLTYESGALPTALRGPAFAEVLALISSLVYKASRVCRQILVLKILLSTIVGWIKIKLSHTHSNFSDHKQL